MRHIQQSIEESREERGKSRLAPRFAPAGQSTQMILGASNERDQDILCLASMLYNGPALKRVYYSAFIPVNSYDARLPALAQAPLARENRLYQADWLMRFYNFTAGDIADDRHPDLDLEIDPKLAWALRHPEAFPLDVNKAGYEDILRVPGIGLRSAQRILVARRHRKLGREQLARMGVVMKRARYFLVLPESPAGPGRQSIQEVGPDYVRRLLTKGAKRQGAVQLSLFERGDTSCTSFTTTKALTDF
jgi:predicted DNA-binding helix-hairpin-helix protein